MLSKVHIVLVMVLGLGASGCAQMSQTDAGALCLQEQGKTLQQYFYKVEGDVLRFVIRNGGTQAGVDELNACLNARRAAMANGQSAFATPLTATLQSHAASPATATAPVGASCASGGAVLQGGAGYCVAR